MEMKSATKKCYICGQHKERTAFAKNAAKPDGLRTECRMCRTVAHRTSRARRRAKEVGAVANVTIKQMRDLMLFTSSSCVYCGADLSDVVADNIHCDHIRPIRRKGASSIGNLIMCCSKCSNAKKDMPAILFTDRLDVLERFIAMENGISTEEATIILAADALEAAGIENADQIATVWILLESFGFDAAGCAGAPTEGLVEILVHFFAKRYGVDVDDPEDIEHLHAAVHAYKEFAKDEEGQSIKTN